MDVLLQVISLLGAGLILSAFVALQRHWWRRDQAGYLWCNLVGAVALLVVAVADRRLGFIIIEGVWAAVSLASILRRDGDGATRAGDGSLTPS